MKWLTAPNMLSLSRIIFLPLLFWLLNSGYHYWFLAAYIVLATTDLFDGVLARKFEQVSHLGKELDSLADLFFYIATAYFIYYLFPEVILANQVYLIIFFSLLGFSFILSAILFRRPVMMHTRILRINAVLVSLLMVASFWFDTTYITRFIIFLYFYGFTEEILIFLIYGNVNPDTKSIFELNEKKREKPPGLKAESEFVRKKKRPARPLFYASPNLLLNGSSHIPAQMSADVPAAPGIRSSHGGRGFVSDQNGDLLP